MVITEALAEIKTLERRITKREENALRYVVRQSIVRDPHEKRGGSEKYVAGERQAVDDLRDRWVQLRLAVNRANFDNSLTVHGITKTVAEWLVWRREVARGQRQFLNKIATTIQNVRAQIERQRLNNEVDAADSELIVNLDEKFLAERIDLFENVIGTLDGALSVFNATTKVD